MARDRVHMRDILWIVTSGAMVASCMTMEPPHAPTVEVNVEGTPKQLAAFDEELRRRLGEEPLSCAVKVGDKVSGCDDLEKKGVSLVRYAFFSRHAELFEVFGKAFNKARGDTFEKSDGAYNKVQDQVQDQSSPVTMKFIAPLVISDFAATCADYGNSSCINAPWCPQYLPHCSTQQKPHCNPC